MPHIHCLYLLKLFILSCVVLFCFIYYDSILLSLSLIPFCCCCRINEIFVMHNKHLVISKAWFMYCTHLIGIPIFSLSPFLLYVCSKKILKSFAGIEYPCNNPFAVWKLWENFFLILTETSFLLYKFFTTAVNAKCVNILHIPILLKLFIIASWGLACMLLMIHEN